MPRFSIIISVYNKEGFIKKTIESALNQSITDYEIIIVNDASTDGSTTIIQSIDSPKIKYHAFAKNKGAAAARNKGIELATGNYLAFLDGDDLWDKDFLAENNSLISNFPDHKVFATAVIIQEHDGKRSSRYSVSNPNNKEQLSLNYFEASLKNTILTSSSAVIERSVFDKTGTYDTSIKSGQDTDLWIRIGVDHRVAFSTKEYVTYSFAPVSLYKSIKTVNDRPKFEAYKTLEKDNKALKKFLDLNRFSLAIRAKIWKEPKEAQFFIDRINTNNLSKKQSFLLSLPAPIIRLLFFIKKQLEKLGIRLSVY